MRILRDKVDIFRKSLDPKNTLGEIYSKVYECNLILRNGQKCRNTLVTQVPGQWNGSPRPMRDGEQKCICYYDAFMELEN
jgi:hypothetical protein